MDIISFWISLSQTKSLTISDLLSIYSETNSWLLQGDPNVPATKVSVYANLTSPLVLTIEQQESLDTLGAVPEHHVTEQSGPAVRQPFRIPEHFSDRDISDIPKFCIFR